MADVIVFPDAVAAVVDYLTAELAVREPTAVVRTRVPNPVPALLVTVRRLGGERRNLVVDAPQVEVACWADDDAGTGEEDAHDLAQLCRGLVNAMAYTGDAYRVDEFAGPALLPDPVDLSRPRYVQTFEIALRGHAA